MSPICLTATPSAKIPTVSRWPYDYSKPGAKDDFIPQHIPLSSTKESNMPEDEHR